MQDRAIIKIQNNKCETEQKQKSSNMQDRAIIKSSNQMISKVCRV